MLIYNLTQKRKETQKKVLTCVISRNFLTKGNQNLTQQNKTPAS